MPVKRQLVKLEVILSLLHQVNEFKKLAIVNLNRRLIRLQRTEWANLRSYRSFQDQSFQTLQQKDRALM
ncbi:hypothetical protein IQ250_03245 [Pseudanabaenaceae cyanobacterium LEGE 13415]|nr:hypothetical protein [Pseudanabaenaceae cyanobacterium LEGE 13415]